MRIVDVPRKQYFGLFGAALMMKIKKLQMRILKDAEGENFEKYLQVLLSKIHFAATSSFHNTTQVIHFYE